MNFEDLTLDVEQSTVVNGPIEKVFESVVYRLGEGNVGPEGTPLQLNIEPFAGGRWYRDRGEGVQHLWGHVQVMKAPTLLELSGPMFMSYPALNHLELKLDEVEQGTKVMLRHRALGLLDPDHKKGVATGWKHLFDSVKSDFEKA